MISNNLARAPGSLHQSRAIDVEAGKTLFLLLMTYLRGISGFLIIYSLSLSLRKPHTQGSFMVDVMTKDFSKSRIPVQLS